MNQRILFLVLAIAMLPVTKIYGQLTVTTGVTAQALVNNICGPGVTSSNVVLNCHNNAYGIFNGTSCNVGIANGVLLTTGKAKNALGPNNDAGGGGTDWGITGSDPDLIAVVGGASTYDECILEFDLVPSCDSIGINYVFASEEYVEFTNRGVNDAFGFFLSGPNPTGGSYTNYDIARIPGTNTLVTIDNIYNDPLGVGGLGYPSSSYPQYYVDNGDGDPLGGCFSFPPFSYPAASCTDPHYIQYDGFTVPLVAKARVQPCQTYHMKLVIADVGDGLWDSGVFLTASGITCVTPQGLQLTTTSTLNCTQPTQGTATVTVARGTPPYTYVWNTIPAQTTATATGLSAGTYKVVVTDNACFHDSTTVTLANVGPVLNVTHVDATCFGGNNGTANVAASAGTPGYTYSWGTSPVQTTAAISGLIAGTYPISVTDSHGCIGVGSAIVGEASQMTVTANTTPATCGNNNGTATAIVAGGTAGYTYLWNTVPIQQTTAAISSLAAGTYSVTATDNHGCTMANTGVLVGGPGNAVNLGPDTILCAGQPLVLNAQNPGSTYLWSASAGGVTTQTYSPTTSGTYSVTVTSGTGCTASGSILVSFSTAPIVALGNDTTLCTGATFQMHAGNPLCHYSWANTNNPGWTAATEAVTISLAGTYSVTVTNNNGCTGTDSRTVTINPLPVVNLGAPVTVCAGTPVTLDAQNAGSAYAWANSAVPAYSATTQTISPTVSGTYSVTVTANSCSATSSAAVTINPLPVVALGPDAIVCVGTLVTLDAQNAGSTYLWNDVPASTTQTISPTTNGTYAVTVTDANNCTGTDTKQVTFNPQPVVNLGAPVTVCAGTLVTLDAGNVGSTYLWSNTATSQTISPTTSNTYSVTVTSNGCTATSSVLVTINPLPIVALGPDATLCTGTPITLDAQNAGSTYIWNNAGASTTRTISPTTTGNYSVTVTDANNCTATDAKQVTFNPLPVVNLGAPVTVCAGTPVTLDAQNAGSTYFWSNNATTQTISPTTSSTYSVTVTTANSCTATSSVLVTINTLPIVNLGADASLCVGDPITIDAGNPGATYLWSNTAATQTISPTITGNYSVTVTDANNCTGTDAKQVTFNPLPVINLGAPVTVCAGTPVTLDAGNVGSTYVWSNAATTQTISPTISNTYSVTVTTSNGCLGSNSVVVTINPKPVVALGADASLCVGTPITIDAGNVGSTYLWSNTATTQTISPTTSATYSVTVTDANNCTGTDSKIVTFNAYPVVNLGPNISVCAGTPVTLDAANPGDTYLWSNTATTQTISPTTNGNYGVTVTAPGNCTANGTVTVTFNPKPTVALGADVSVCVGVPVTLNAGNVGSTYHWSFNNAATQTISPTASNTYSVTVTDANNCTATDDVLVTFNPIPVVTLGPDLVKCDGDPVTLDAGNVGATYHWSNAMSTETISPTTTGTYQVTVTSPFLCVGTGSVSVTFNTLPTKGLQDESTCIGNSLTLDAGNTGSTYLWSTAETTESITSTTAGPYSVTITNSNNCTVVDGATLSFNSPGSINIGVDTGICPGEHKILDATFAGASYVWSDNSTAATLDVVTAGTYSVTATVNGHCTMSDDITLTAKDVVAVTLADSAICTDKSLVLDAGNPGAIYVWSTGQSTQTITVKEVGAYGVSVSNQCNTATAEMNLTNRDCNCYIYMANVFSPNGDGQNDKFGAIRYCDSLQNFKLRIYDRWGEVIFETTDPAIQWDGSFDGKPMEPGVYVWQLTYSGKNDDEWGDQAKHGSLTLIR